MNCDLIVLWVGIIDVRGKKFENRGNVRTGENCKPIDTAKNALIDFYLMRKIRIEGVNWRNGINGEA